MPNILPPQKQKAIFKLAEEGYSNASISRKLKLNWKTVKRYIQRRKGQRKRVIRVSLGRPTLLKNSYLSRLKTTLKRKVCRTAKDVKKAAKIVGSLPTIRKGLRKIGAKYALPKRVRFLSAKNKEKRLTFAREKLASIVDWKNCLFVDEKKFNTDGPDGHLHTWHLPGQSTHIPFRSQCYRQSVQIFCGVAFDYKSSVIFLTTTLKAVDYAPLLKGMLEEARTKIPLRKLSLYQDNAPCHVAKFTLRELEVLGIETVNPPGVSPDLNPIENIWGELSRIVYKESFSFQTIDDLKKAIREGWEAVSLDVVNSCVLSVPRRLLALSDAEGGVIEY
jgi:transposase